MTRATSYAFIFLRIIWRNINSLEARGFRSDASMSEYMYRETGQFKTKLKSVLFQKYYGTFLDKALQ